MANFARSLEAKIAEQTLAIAARDAEIAALNGTIRSLQSDLQAHKDALAQWEGSHEPE